MSWVLAALAGVLGAAAFTHSAGYFVTFMTGNTERVFLGLFQDQRWLAVGAAWLLVSFVGGVVVASLCRRYVWVNHPHGATVLTTFALVVATVVDTVMRGWTAHDVAFVPIIFVAFGIGALNTSFVKDGEVSIPLSYVTGTLVKMGQGIERHLTGGELRDWLGYFLLWAGFAAGAIIGGFISVVVSGSQMLLMATLVCGVTAAYTYFFFDRQALLK